MSMKLGRHHNRNGRRGQEQSILTSLLLLVFSPWAGLGRDQSSVSRLV